MLIKYMHEILGDGNKINGSAFYIYNSIDMNIYTKILKKDGG
ncbi:MAG TPA: hypothetical protein VGF79_14890 [Bacteroidia bacterium]